MNDPCFDAIISLRKQYGTVKFDHAMKKLNRMRLEAAGYQREKRVHFPPRMYQMLFDRQSGVCPRCNKTLNVPAKRNEIDHVNVERQDFNHPSNLQLLHSGCNRSKGANSIHEESKATGKGYVEILGDEP